MLPPIDPLAVAGPIQPLLDDPTVSEVGHEKLLGKDVLIAAVARHGEHARNVYFPGGASTAWVDLHTREWFRGGTWSGEYPVYLQGRLTLPAFARDGAILPALLGGHARLPHI